MNIVLAIAALVQILVAVEVLAAMRPGVTCWFLLPTWVGIAVAAFGSLFVAGSIPWPIVAAQVGAAGMLWRLRGRFVWEAQNAKPQRLSWWTQQ